MTSFLQLAFLRTLRDERQRQCESTAEPHRFTVSDILHADECSDWVARSIGLGGGADFHTLHNLTNRSTDHA